MPDIARVGKRRDKKGRPLSRFTDFLRGRDLAVDETPRTFADESFERWLATPGTEFLPDDTRGWPVAMASPALIAALRTGGPASYDAIYRSQTSVYTVVEYLGWQISQLSLKHYRRVDDTDRRELNGSTVANVLRRPAPGLTYPRLMSTTTADFYVYGNAFWALLSPPDSAGGPFVIVPVPPAYVQARGGTLIEAAEYEITVGGNRMTLPAERVVHFRRNNPTDRRIGVSPLEPLRAILREEYESSRYRARMWEKDARMGGFIARPENAPPMDPEARTRFRGGLDKFTKGGSNEGSWMLLEEGERPYPAAFSPREAEFIEGRKLTLETVCRALNVPLPVMGLSESVAYASQREHHKALYQDTLPPITRTFEPEIEAKVLPWINGGRVADDEYLEFNIEEKMRGAFEDQASYLGDAVGGPYMTRNEARARLNLPRIDDPAADELVLTNNMQLETDASTDDATAPVVRLAPAEGGTP